MEEHIYDGQCILRAFVYLNLPWQMYKTKMKILMQEKSLKNTSAAPCLKQNCRT